MTETTDNFIPYLRLVIYVNNLLGNCICVRGVVVPTVAYQTYGCEFTFFFLFLFFLMFFFSLLLSQCDFNINLMPYSVSPTFFTPYDAQACSALII